MITSQRIRFAQELHDGIAQDLVGLGYAIDLILASSENLSERDSLRALRLDVISIIDKVRREIFQLRQTTGDVDVLHTEPEIRVILERVFKEIIDNVLTHSQASDLKISISDNGLGGAQEKFGHHGLQGIRERVEELDGTCVISSDFIGTTIALDIPIATP